MSLLQSPLARLAGRRAFKEQLDRISIGDVSFTPRGVTGASHEGSDGFLGFRIRHYGPGSLKCQQRLDDLDRRVRQQPCLRLDVHDFCLALVAIPTFGQGGEKV